MTNEKRSQLGCPEKIVGLRKLEEVCNRRTRQRRCGGEGRSRWGRVSDVDVVCDAQRHKAKAIAKASHRDAVDHEASGKALPQGYQDSEDEDFYDG
ncbi:hypothetical protein LWI29_034528 [Acer saccharum]|uniref:Uncharacterized protein n=1 Tax=Acer saccharum TaxID=4024 RepID=A0AA39TFC1_ACESA|nr:hypothetical protein LWI29_034528 [Acer saccharum]